MPTLPGRAAVSLLAAISLGACTTHTGAAGTAPDEPAPARARPLAIRFTNEGRAAVHVYLVGDRREWLLGRVDPGGVAWLALPTRSLVADGGGGLRLAVLAAAAPTLTAGRDARAVQSLSQPATAILAREWTFAQGQLVSLAPRAASRRPLVP